MARNYIAFDIETAKVIPGRVEDLMAHRPLGIACAATLAAGEDAARLWHGRNDDESPAGRMTHDESAELVRSLAESAANGATILTWNGLGFDFDILAEESGLLVECRQLALAHVDMMFHVFCEKGYPISLDKAAQGMGLPGKQAGVPQHLVPQFWSEGRYDEVLGYVSQDVRATLDLALACERARKLSWITRKGIKFDLPLRSGWLTAEAALQRPEPDTSWMDRPMSRAKFAGWTRT